MARNDRKKERLTIRQPAEAVLFISIFSGSEGIRPGHSPQSSGSQTLSTKDRDKPDRVKTSDLFDPPAGGQVSTKRSNLRQRSPTLHSFSDGARISLWLKLFHYNYQYLMGVRGLEPRTSSMSTKRSNQLSYTPIKYKHYRRDI